MSTLTNTGAETNTGADAIDRTTHWIDRSLQYLTILLTGLVVFAIARSGWYTPESLLGYTLGIAGATLMFALMSYPLAKRVMWLQRKWPLRNWFRMHMLFGILGPLLILLHCNLRVASPNAAVALWSMIVVASSGVFGRYIYQRLNAGAYGRQRTFGEVSEEAKRLLDAVARRAGSNSGVIDELTAFAQSADRAASAGWTRPLQLLGLSLTARATFVRCRQPIELIPDHGLREQVTRAVKRYLESARDASQFRAFERAFSLWHALHIPLVALLAISTVVHVIAVHMF